MLDVNTMPSISETSTSDRVALAIQRLVPKIPIIGLLAFPKPIPESPAWAEKRSAQGIGNFAANVLLILLASHEPPARPSVANVTRLSPSEAATGSRLAETPAFQDRKFTESPHVGAEYLDDLGRSYDQMGDPRASEHWNEAQFFRSIDKHMAKSNDFTVIDLTYFSKEQAAAIRAYVGALPTEAANHFILIK